MPISNCETLVKTKVLAAKRGLNPDVISCPFMEIRNSCDGKICIYKASLEREHGTVELVDPDDAEFNEERREELEDRIENCLEDDFVRLTRLREELRKLRDT